MSRARFRTARYGGVILVALLVLLVGSLPATADTTAQQLPFSQDWSNTGLITVSDDWSGVPGRHRLSRRRPGGRRPAPIRRRSRRTGAPPIDVNANQTAPNTFTTGGVSEFEIANPVVALQGSGTADAPHVVLVARHHRQDRRHGRLHPP